MKNAFYQFLSCVIILSSLVSCKNDSATSVAINDPMEAAEKAYIAEPSMATGNSYLRELGQKLTNPNLSAEQRKTYLSEGIKISKEQNLTNRQGGFLFPYIKDNGKEAGIDSKIYDLALLMKSNNKNAAANVLFKGLTDMYPDFKNKAEIESHMTESISSVDDYVKSLGAKIFDNPDDVGVNRKSALQYVDVCEAYVLVYPESTAAPEFLFKAAEVAKSIQTFPKSLSIYDWMINKYPDYEKTPTAMFLKGFIIENNLGNDSLALVNYKAFISRYPNDDLVDDANFLIENLGKTDEEILQMIEEKRKSKQ